MDFLAKQSESLAKKGESAWIHWVNFFTKKSNKPNIHLFESNKMDGGGGVL